MLSTEPSPTVTFDDPGVYTVELEVTDPAGAARTATVPVVVGNAPPEVRFAAPLDGDFVDPDRTIEFRVVVRDRDGWDDLYDACRDL